MRPIARIPPFPLFIALLVLVFVVAVVFAPLALSDPPARDHDIGVDDYFTVAVITDCAASPDGKYVAYCDLRWEPPAEDRNTDLWLVPTDGARPARRLTFDPAADTSPHWSPDSRWIYFTSARTCLRSANHISSKTIPLPKRSTTTQ